MRLPLPTTIVTGTLSVGKTTAIASLLSRRPTGEKWAVLVNEFGALGIDGALLQAAAETTGDNQVNSDTMDGVTIKQLAGGCLCCAAAGMLAPAIAMLVRKAKPDRLIIEPSGLGHPAGLLDILQGGHLRSAILVQAVICLVDPKVCRILAGLPLDQVNIADVVVATKADMCTSAELSDFSEWAKSLYPPKEKVEIVERGALDLKLLDTVRAPGLAWVTRDSDAQPESTTSFKVDGPVNGISNPTIGKPVRYEASNSTDGSAVGWMFSSEDIFQAEHLLAFLSIVWPLARRIKGIFRIGDKTWAVPSLVATATSAVQVSDKSTQQHPPSHISLGELGDESSAVSRQLKLEEIAYRKESRLEIIIPPVEQQESAGCSITSGIEGLALAPKVDQAAAAVLEGDWEKVERFLLSILKS